MFWNVFGELLLFWCSTANITGCLENTNLENADLENTPGGALGYFGGGYVPPGTPNWHPVLEKISPKIDTPF